MPDAVSLRIEHSALRIECGGGSRTRTGDIRLAKPTLYQLSYAPDSAREAGSGSVSVCTRRSSVSFWEAGEQARFRHVSPGLALAHQMGESYQTN